MLTSTTTFALSTVPMLALLAARPGARLLGLAMLVLVILGIVYLAKKIVA